MTGVFLRKGDELLRMSEAPYDEEAVLQELLGRHPQLLSGDDGDSSPWLLVKREAVVQLGDGGPLRGMLDHLFLDADGVPTLVEVKRSSDSRIRREVVGQLLDYAANASTAWTADVLRAWFEESCAGRGEDPGEALIAAFPEVDDTEQYWRGVRTNLQADRLRIVFVADEIPPALRRIVEYLNRQMISTEVIAIEVKQYVDGDGVQQMVVPRAGHGRRGPGRPTSGRSSCTPPEGSGFTSRRSPDRSRSTTWRSAVSCSIVSTRSTASCFRATAWSAGRRSRSQRSRTSRR